MKILKGLFGGHEPVVEVDVAMRIADNAIPYLADLSERDRQRLREWVVRLLSHVGWEPVKDFDLTDEIIATIAGFAALLVLGLDHNVYDDVKTVVVHPSTIVMTGQRQIDRWVVADGPQAVLGHTAFGGPVHIAWNAVTRDVRHPERGHNVVIHEFAHRLDLTDGAVDGTPTMQAGDRERWVQLLQREFDGLRGGEGSPLLRDYAATNPGEFFAVITEVFFSQPRELREDRPDVYRVLSDYYRQDPAARADP